MTARRSTRSGRRFLVGLAVIDAPVIVAAVVFGSIYGFVHTYETVSAWRLAHPWSFAPSLILAALLVRRWRRAR